MKRLFVGTERGLHLLTETGEGWRLDHCVLPDLEIGAVARRPGDGRLFVATRKAGLFLVDPQTGVAETVGEGVLPRGIRCIAIAPGAPHVVVLGCEPAAMYRSVDGGVTWSECGAVAELARARGWQYHIAQIPAHIRQILIDRRTPERVVAAVQIGGVILSEDGGRTWTDVTASIDPDVHALVQDREDADILYATTGGGGPIGGPHPAVPPNGYALYRSRNGGRDWEPMSAGMDRQHAVPIHSCPQGANVLLAAVARGTPPQWRRPGGAEAILVVSRDRGATWSQIGGGLPASFETMIDSIDAEAAPGGRTYLGIGGEGTKVLPPDRHRGFVYYADDLDGPWLRLPREFPTVFTVTAG